MSSSRQRPIPRPHAEDPINTPVRQEPDGQLLYTPQEAATRLRIPESWLRRKAGQRKIPSTRLGKHLRFSDADLSRIVAIAAAESARRRSTRRRST
jgi:excisionase family DNA binding protein